MVNGIPDDILTPRNTWNDPEAYDKKAKQLAKMFAENFEQFRDQASEEIVNAGPTV